MQFWTRNFQTAAEPRGVYFVANSCPSCSSGALSPWQMEGERKSASAPHRRREQKCSGRMLLGQCSVAWEYWKIAFPLGELRERETTEAQRISITKPRLDDWQLNLIKETYRSITVSYISYRKILRSSSLLDLHMKSSPCCIHHSLSTSFLKSKISIF